MKDFQREAFQQPEQSSSPYVFATQEISSVIQKVHTKTHYYFTLGMIAATFFVSPLQTISTSLQLSVQPHKNIYQNMTQAKSKQLAKMNTQMTVHEKKNFQLMIRSGKRNPYIAPVYSGYLETIKDLISQGWRSFFKGAHLRAFNCSTHLLGYYFIGPLINQNSLQNSKSLIFFKVLMVNMIIDIVNTPVFMLENRYVLQTGIKQFKIFRKSWKDIYRAVKMQEGFDGWKFHIPNNVIEMFTRFPFYITLMYAPNKHISGIYSLYFLAQFLIYPFQTAFRRITCQTDRYPGMIPLRYKSIMHGVKVIGYQQGVKGLYRGFGLYSISVLIKLEIMRVFLMVNNFKQVHTQM